MTPKLNYGYIYCYTSPSGKKYIGKTIRSLKTRAGNNGSGYKNCTALMRAFRKYGYQNFEIEILEEIPYEYLNEREKYYISLYNTQDPNFGYNIKPGGAVEYSSNNNSSKRAVNKYDLSGVLMETYESISEAARVNNVPYQAISQNCRKEINHYKNYVYRYADNNSEFIPVVVKQTHGHITAQYDLAGEFIASYESANAAARALCKDTFAGRNIRAVCEGKRKTAFGYKWAYLD